MADISFGEDKEDNKQEASTNKKTSGFQGNAGSLKLAKPGMTVELVTGEYWTDDLSGIELVRGLHRLLSSKELRDPNIDPDVKARGYVELEEKPIAVLPEGKDLSRVEKALKMNILKVHDPARPVVYHAREDDPRRIVHDDRETASGMRHTSEDDKLIVGMLKLDFEKFKVTLDKIDSLETLETLYYEEHQGRNPTSAPRRLYVNAIKRRMAEKDVNGVGKIKVTNEDDTIYVTGNK